MAELKGDVATDVQAGNLENLVANGLVDARSKKCLDSYTIGGSTEVAGSTLDLGATIPKGARVVQIGLWVDTAQSSLTFTLGDDATADRYVKTGDTSLQTADTLHLFSGQNYKTGQTDGDDQIVLTTEAATMTAGQLEFFVEYTMD